MVSKLGTALPRQRSGHIYLVGALGLAVFCAVEALRGKYSWSPAEWASGVAVFLYLIPWLTPRRRENVQVDHTGVIVITGKGPEEVHWNELTRARIITTSTGPWSEDVFFVLEGTGGKGCVVSHGAAVRTKLLEEMKARLEGIDDRKIIEAMGSTSRATFLIWEKPGTDKKHQSKP